MSRLGSWVDGRGICCNMEDDAEEQTWEEGDLKCERKQDKFACLKFERLASHKYEEVKLLLHGFTPLFKKNSKKMKK